LRGEDSPAGEAARIRPYRPEDLGDLYRICLLTADNGQDATLLYPDPRLPGDVFAAPYGTFEPSLAFVAVDAAGVGGYILGALDTEDFESRLERDWWPAMRRRYPAPPAGLPEPEWSPDWSREQQLANLIHHRPPAQATLTARYPSHLHIDLLPRLQGRGLGRRLIETLTGALRAHGSRGVHLHVGRGNERAAAFYARVGFTEQPVDIPGVRLFVMDLS
jgi:GNAT superfamily N-acetyltransferase